MEWLAETQRSWVHRHRAGYAIGPDIGRTVHRELADMDRPGPQEGRRLEDSDRSLNGRVEPAWNVQSGEDRPAQSRDRSLERRRPERRHRQFERPVPCLAGAKMNIARNLDWLEDEILTRRFRMARCVAVGIRCGDLVLPVLDRAKRHDE